MKKNGASVKEASPLPSDETASVPATADKSVRYLFAIPKFREGGMFDSDMLPLETVKMELKGPSKPTAVTLTSDDSPLAFDYADGTLSVTLPVEKRSKLVDVVKIELPQ